MRSTKGFTMIELMVILAIIAVIMAIAMPNMIDWRTNAKFRGAVNNVTGDLNLARTMAVKENSFVVVLFAADSYQVFVDNGANPGNWIHEADERLLRNRELPSGIAIDLAATDFDTDRTRFNERGLPENLGRVVVTSMSGHQRDIQLNRLGRILVQ